MTTQDETAAMVEAATRIVSLYETGTREQIDALQAERLHALVVNARERSPFYAERLRGIDLNAPALLRRLPTLDKVTMIENLPAIFTDPRLRDLDLAAHVSGLNGDELLFDEYRVMASGGTSGVRSFYVYDRRAWAETAASMAAAAIKLQMGPRETKIRAATIWAAGAAHMSRRIAMSFNSPAYERLSLSAMAPVSELASALDDFQPEWLSGYPSILSLLAGEQIAGRLQISPRTVMTTSEQCTPGMRARIASAWGSEPFNTYSATEGGGMAVECDHHGGMHIDESQVVIEIVDDADDPVPDGQRGARVLLTNLYNHTQPLIRFELTDILTIAADTCPCGRASKRITAIDGRTDDIMRLTDPTGNSVPVHPNQFAEAIEAIAAVSAYQVTEAIDGVEIAIVSSEDVTDTVAARVHANLELLGLMDTPIRARRVEHIERPNRASGKFKLVEARRL